MKSISRYFWFISKSQSFQKGNQGAVKTFFESLVKGFTFVKMCNTTDQMIQKYGAETTYAMLDRMVEL